MNASIIAWESSFSSGWSHKSLTDINNSVGLNQARYLD